MYRWMYPPPRTPAEGTGGSNESTCINAKVKTKVTFRKKRTGRPERKQSACWGVIKQCRWGWRDGETERETEGVGMAGRNQPSGQKTTEPPTSDSLHDDACGLQASEMCCWAPGADSETAVGELGTAPSQRRSVTSHCDGQREWLRCQGYSRVCSEQLYSEQSIDMEAYGVRSI